VRKKDFKKINDYLWEIPRFFRKDMRVPARIYTSEKMLENIEEGAIKQVINVATLPGVVKYSFAMPDVHTGYGFVIGGVAAIRTIDGVISPGGVGYDINCGIKLLKSDLTEKDVHPFLDKLATEIQQQVPSGLGKGREVKLSIKQIDKILEQGAGNLIENGYGEEQDIENCESEGKLDWADASVVSERAKNRGRNQVGTLGSGNHFISLEKIAEIYDEKAAEAMGLFKDQVVIMLHTGSRGLGHQIASDYIKLIMRVMPKYNIRLPDRELAACPINSLEGKRYFSAMACGANYAWANRQMITHYIRQAWSNILGAKACSLTTIYDVAHNIAKIEEHEVDGRKMKLLVHRKGATRAFPPGHPDLPECYQKTGQPVLVPGTMGTASYVLVGRKESAETWHSVCHGAGRAISRRAAARKISGAEVVRSLAQKGIIIKCHSIRGISEEAPLAYKDIDSVVEVVHNAKLAKKVAKLRPLAVIKGE